jgi:zinc transporter 1
VLIHLLGDAINNIGVIISGVIILCTHSPARFYADPAVSLWIAIMILATSIPLTKKSGAILLQSAPPGLKLDDVKHDLESIPGVKSVHELHVWQLTQKKAVATAHVVVEEESLDTFMENAKTVGECLHAYGIHSATLQPELLPSVDTSVQGEATGTATQPGTRRSSLAGSLRQRSQGVAKCLLTCGSPCE